MAITNRKVFGFGSAVGFVVAATVVLTDSLRIFFTPLWQELLLYPGFLVGGALYNLSYPRFLDASAETVAVWVGVAAVAATYGGIAVLLRKIALRLWGGNGRTAKKPSSA